MKIREWSNRASLWPADVTAAAALLAAADPWPGWWWWPRRSVPPWCRWSSPARGAGPAHPVGLAAGVSLALAALPLRWWGAIAAQRRQVSPEAATAGSWQGGPEAPPYGGKQLRLAWGIPPDHATPKRVLSALGLAYVGTAWVDVMASPESAKEQRRLLLAEFGVGGWIPTAHHDGWDSNGQPTSWEEWEHRYGRRAIVNADGRCSDPELEELLRAQLEATKGWRRPWALVAGMAVLRWGVRLLGWQKRQCSATVQSYHESIH
jgi:hypothetical protein